MTKKSSAFSLMFTEVYIQRNLTQLCYVFVYMFKETCPSFNLLNVKKASGFAVHNNFSISLTCGFTFGPNIWHLKGLK